MDTTTNIQFLQDEVLNTVDRCRLECENLTIAEVLGVLEMVKLHLYCATFNKENGTDE